MATKFELGNGITCDADQLESAINEVQKYKKVKPEDRATISEKITEPKLKYVRVMKDGKSVIKLDAKKNKVQEPVLDDDDKPVTITKNRVQVTDIADCDKKQAKIIVEVISGVLGKNLSGVKSKEEKKQVLTY